MHSLVLKKLNKIKVYQKVEVVKSNMEPLTHPNLHKIEALSFVKQLGCEYLEGNWSCWTTWTSWIWLGKVQHNMVMGMGFVPSMPTINIAKEEYFTECKAFLVYWTRNLFFILSDKEKLDILNIQSCPYVKIWNLKNLTIGWRWKTHIYFHLSLWTGQGSVTRSGWFQ